MCKRMNDDEDVHAMTQFFHGQERENGKEKGTDRTNGKVMKVHTRITQSAKQQQHEVHYSNNDGRTSMHIYIHTAHVHTPFMFK